MTCRSATISDCESDWPLPDTDGTAEVVCFFNTFRSDETLQTKLKEHDQVVPSLIWHSFDIIGEDAH